MIRQLHGAYLQPVFVVLDKRRRYAFHSLTNFDIATGGDDFFNANNMEESIVSLLTLTAAEIAAEILTGY